MKTNLCHHFLRQTFLPLALLLPLVGFVACTNQKKDPVLQVIAKVNGEPIYLKDFLVNYQQLKGEQDDISQKNKKLADQLKIRALNEVIIMTLVMQEAGRKKLWVAKEEVEGRLGNWKDSYPAGGFEEMLKKQNTTVEYLKRRIQDQLLVEKLTETMFADEIRVSDDEVKSFYKGHEGEFVRPEKAHVLHILVATKEEAEKLRQEIISNKQSFESVALTHSLSPDTHKKGDLGFFAKNEKIPAFNEAFNLSVGMVSKPISSRYGFHLLKVKEKLPSKKLSLEESKSDIVKILKRDKEIKIYKEWVTKLLKDGDIQRNETLFANI